MKKNFLLVGLITLLFPFSNQLFADSCIDECVCPCMDECVYPCIDECVCPCTSRFHGLYLGGNIGFVSFSSYRNDLESPRSFSVNGTSWTAGIQLGYDWACLRNSLILGFVGDWNWSHAKNETSVSGFELTNPSIEVRLRWFSTLRARVGFPFQPCLLVYLTGGAAVADFHTRLKSVQRQVSFHTDPRWGWTAGFGAEWIVRCHWSINAEILYARFRKESVTLNVPRLGIAPVSGFDLYDNTWVGRIGINYRFSL